MAMNKKEKELLKTALTAAAFHRTTFVDTDLEPPEGWGELVVGWCISVYRGTVGESCSSAGQHSLHSTTKTTSQNSIRQYSTKLRALKALRWEIEQKMAVELRNIDILIENELK